MSERIEVKTAAEAWKVANIVFPSDYIEDKASSDRAGYPVFRGALSRYDYICDLGDRLEINLADGRTVNIWIKGEEEKPKTLTLNLTKSQIADLLIATTSIRFNFNHDEIFAETDEKKEIARRSAKKWEMLHDIIKKQFDAQF